MTGLYASALMNLNPLLEYDGYYVLMDLLSRPNLRQHSLAWWGGGFLKALRAPGEFREHWVELVYGLGSLLYVLVMAVWISAFYRLTVESWLAQILSPATAASVAWLFALGVVLMAAAATANDVLNARRSRV